MSCALDDSRQQRAARRLRHVLRVAVVVQSLAVAACDERSREPAQNAEPLSTTASRAAKPAKPAKPVDPPTQKNSPAELVTGDFFSLLVTSYLNADERKNGRRAAGGFDSGRIAAWPIAQLEPWLAEEITVDDTNLAPHVRSFSHEAGVAQLRERAGLFHVRLAHIAHLRSEKDMYFPGKDDNDPGVRTARAAAEKYDSTLSEEVREGDVIATVGQEDGLPLYTLVFKLQDQQPRLVRLVYHHLDGD